MLCCRFETAFSIFRQKKTRNPYNTNHIPHFFMVSIGSLVFNLWLSYGKSHCYEWLLPQMKGL